MISDQQLRLDIVSHLSADPCLDDSGIQVAVNDGVVTLGGHVPSFAEKWTAERLTKNLAGVRALANDIEVKPLVLRSDAEIAAAALDALQNHVAVPAANLKVIVRNGWLSLEGHVPFWHQSDAAERAVRGLWGVKGVINTIVIRPTVDGSDISNQIRAAFSRRADFDPSKVHVAVNDRTVRLTGEVHSWREREEAENAARATAGVSQVQNDLSLSI